MAGAFTGEKVMGKRETRPATWARLCGDMSDALSGLIEMKLDLDNIQSVIDEIAETELPMGFGRD